MKKKLQFLTLRYLLTVMFNDSEIHASSAPLSPSYILKLLKSGLNLNSEETNA